MNRLQVRKRQRKQADGARKALKSLDWRLVTGEDTDEKLTAIKRGLATINPQHLTKDDQATLDFLRTVVDWLL